MMTKIEPLEARIALATFVVSNNLDSGPGSLRQAILEANALDGLDHIRIGVAHNLVISPITPLPEITDPIYIFSATAADDPTLIDGSNISGDSGSGLTLLGPDSSGSTIRGLAIYGFADAGVEIVNSSANVIEGCYLGVDDGGRTGANRMDSGVLVNGGADNKITSSVVCGNESGIRITGGAVDTWVTKNNIGIGFTGRTATPTAIPNDTGILVEKAERTLIEGNDSIAANTDFGVKLTSQAKGTEIYNNYIGVKLQSPGQIGTQKWGIYDQGSAETRIGGGDFSSPVNRGNTITGNTLGGIYVVPGKNGLYTWIEGNTIGASSSTQHPNGNGGPGVFVTDPLKSNAPIFIISSNLIAGNEGAGIEIRDLQLATQVEITGNLIGADKGGTKPLGNGTGIIVENSTHVSIGGSYSLGNTIVASEGDGILIKNCGFVQILGNNVGYATRVDGAPEFGNAGHGIHLVGTGYVSIGYGNIITSNGGDGIRIDDFGRLKGRWDRSFVRITGNFVGTDGFAAKGNLGAGIHVLDLMPEGGRVVIGDETSPPNLNGTGGGNVVSGNQGDGILVERADKVSIAGNYVGTDFRGLNPLGNGGDGIALIDTNWSRISGSLVAANLGHGIRIVGNSLDPSGDASSNGNIITRTNIGLATDGNTRMENALSAIVIDNAHTTLIGDESFGNRVFGKDAALQLNGAKATRVFNSEFRSSGGPAVVLEQGTSGTQFGGDGEYGNLVVSEAHAALLVADGSSNNIANNRLESPTAGVSIISGSYNSIIGNQFKVGVDGLFIDLGGDGVTPNDPLDVDSGPNNLLNSPSLLSAAIRDGRTMIRGEYRGAADAEITVSWYANGSRVGTSVVRTDATGMAKLELDLEEEFTVGVEFRACGTTYAAEGSNTSEFSNAVFAMEAPDVVAKGAAPGQKARAQLVDVVTGEVIFEQVPFGKGYRGGVRVAAADVDGDGIADLIATQRKGNGVVKIYSGLDGHLINSFWLGATKGSAIRSLAVGDLDGDGSMEIVTGLTHTKGGRVLVHDALTGAFEADFAPFGAKIPSRLSVGLSDADGDGHPEIIVLSGSKRVVLDPMSGQIEQLARLVKGLEVA